MLRILSQGVFMGKRKLKKVEANAKLTWAEWLIEGKKALAIQDDQPQDSNFFHHDQTRQGVSGAQGPSGHGVLPRVLPKHAKKRKKPL